MSTLTTCAVLGFVIGPTIGALFCEIDATMYGLPVNANNTPGFLILAANIISFIQVSVALFNLMILFSFEYIESSLSTTCIRLFCSLMAKTIDLVFLSGQEDEETYNLGSSTETNESSVTFDASMTMQKEDKEADNLGGIGTKSNLPSISYNDKEPPFNSVGVIMSNFFSLVHNYSFAVQETMIAPMVMKLYDWSPVQINILFAGAGVISLITSFSVRYISRHVQDQALLIASIVIGLLGSILQMDIPQIETVLPMHRFILGFSFSTMAFPMGTSVVLGLYSNILAPMGQGRWTGMIIAVSCVPPALGPFLALEALEAVDWRTWLEFGLCSLLFLIALLGAFSTISSLVPYSEFVARMPISESIDICDEAKLAEEVSSKECL